MFVQISTVHVLTAKHAAFSCACFSSSTQFQELATCDPSYYKWTQALFLELHKVHAVRSLLFLLYLHPHANFSLSIIAKGYASVHAHVLF